MSQDIDYTIGLITKQFEDAIKKNEQTVKQFNDQFQKQTKQTSGIWDSFVGNLSAQTFLNIAKSIGSMGQSFIDAAKDIEDMSVQFTVLTGSAGQSKKLIEDLQKFGAETPFEMKGLSTASKSLLAYGFTAQEIIPKLKQIGDVSSATGNSIEELSQIYGQVAATGKITGERLAQLQERGVPALAAIATQLGVTSAKAREMISSTNGVSFEVFEKAFASLSAKGGIAFEGMIKQSKTLSGVMSTAGDEVTMFAADMGAKLLPTMKAAVLQVGAFINVLRSMVDWIGKNVDWLIPLAAGITAVSLATLIWAQRQAILSAATAVATTVQLGFNAAVSANPVGLIIIAIGAAVAAIVALYRNLDSVTLKMYEFGSAILTALLPMEQGFRKIMGGIITIFAETTGTLIQGAIDLGSEFAGIFGITLPDSMTDFKDNLLETAASITNGSGTIQREIDSLTAKAASLRTEMNKPKEEAAAEEEGPAKQSKADQIREEQLAKEKEFQNQLRLMRVDHNAQMSLIDLEYQNASKAIQAEDQELSLEQRQAIQEEAIVNAYDFELAKIEATRQAELNKAALIKDSQDKAKAVLAANQKAELDKEKAQGKYKIDIAKQVIKEKNELAQQEKQIQESLLNSAQGYLAAAASLMKKGSKEAKALAITDAVIATYLGATKAMASVPFPANFVAAGAVIAGGLANVGKITSSGNYANGGEVPGTSIAGDQNMYGLDAGEVVLNHAMKKNLSEELSGRGGMSDEQVDRIINAFQNMQIVMVADDNEVARSASRGAINGIVIGSTR